MALGMASLVVFVVSFSWFIVIETPFSTKAERRCIEIAVGRAMFISRPLRGNGPAIARPWFAVSESPFRHRNYFQMINRSMTPKNGWFVKLFRQAGATGINLGLFPVSALLCFVAMVLFVKQRYFGRTGSDAKEGDQPDQSAGQGN